MSRLGNTVQGKSLIFNALFILLNITGLTFLVLGYHPNFLESALVLKIIGYLLMLSTLVAVYVFQGWTLFGYVARVLVGGLFIVSGLIKANDPIGFAYKLEEYFEDGALAYRVKDIFGWETFTLEFLIPYALTFSILICIVEIVLGVLAIIGVRIKLTAWLMLLMMVFFTLLTWHTKECDPHTTFRDVDTYDLNSSIAQIKIAEAPNNERIEILKQDASTVTIAEIKKPQCVEDCGCFGDAMKGSIGRSLTPAESFWKDIVLLYFVLLIFLVRGVYRPNTTKENVLLIAASAVFILFFSWLFTWYFPVFFGLTSILLALWIRRAGGKLLGNDLGTMLLLTLLSSAFVAYVMMYRPVRDYRPYHHGSNLIEKMNDGIPSVIEIVQIYENTQTRETRKIIDLDESTQEIWGNPDLWKWSGREERIIKQGKLPSITDQFNPKIPVEMITEAEKNLPIVQAMLAANQTYYVDLVDRTTGDRFPQLLEDFYMPEVDTARFFVGDTLLRLQEDFQEVDLRDFILEAPQIIWVVARDLSNANFSRMERLKDIFTAAQENQIPMILMTASSQRQIEAFRNDWELNIPIVLNDETEIKAITRSNPTLMVIRNGVVSGKYAFRSTPSWDWLIKNQIIQL